MPSTLYQLLQASYGVRSTTKTSLVGVQILAAGGKLLSFNPNRLGLIIVNNGANVAYITPDKSAAVGHGIRLINGGGTMALKWDVDFELVASEWYGIADGADSDVYIVEIVSY